MGRCSTALRAVLTSLAVAFLIAGIIVYAIYTSQAKHNTEQALAELGVSANGLSSVVHDQWLATIITMSVLTALLFALAMYRTCTTFSVYRSAPSAWFITACFIVGTLLWLATLWLIIVACAYTMWVGSTAILATNTDEAINAVGGKLAQVQAVIADLKQFIGYYNAGAASAISAPLRSQLSPILADVIVKMQPSATGCPAGCLDLSGWSWWLSGQSCVCDLNRLKAAQPYTTDAWKQVAVGLGGLLLMWIGATWLFAGLWATVSRAFLERAIADGHNDPQIILGKDHHHPSHMMPPQQQHAAPESIIVHMNDDPNLPKPMVMQPSAPAMQPASRPPAGPAGRPIVG